MTLMLWICSLAVTGLLLTAWREGRDAQPDRWWSYPVQPALAVTTADESALMRANARPALQTGAAILAVALALDLSTPAQALFAPLESPAASSAAASGLLDLADNSAYVDLGGYAPSSWSLSANTDGWFV